MTAPFDEYADTYRDEVQSSISFAGQDVEYFTRRKADLVREISRRILGPCGHLLALDVGSGNGSTDSLLDGHFGLLVGCDPSLRSTAHAASANRANRYFAADGGALPCRDQAVDVAFAINVLHHVEPAHRDAFLREMTRVVRPGGLVLLFEHNPWNPLTRVSVARCEFDEGVELLTTREMQERAVRCGLEPVEHRYIVFTPIDSARLHRIENRLGWLPLGAQHYVAARRSETS